LRVNPLDALFRPASVAIIGASSDPSRIGGRPVRFSKYAFKGALLPVNPNQKEIQGLPAYPSIKDVPGPVDQAIIAVPAKLAMQAADECIAKGVKAAVMFSSGFAETGADGRAMQNELKRRCAAGGMKLLGPNSLGMFNVEAGLYSTFSGYFDPLWPRRGPVGIVSQSGAFGTYFLALAVERGLGCSHFVATGNEADIDVAACVEWLADDPATGVIMIYLEGCGDGARLRAALARAAANRKPVIAMKVGVSEQGVAAIASHTGTLAGSDAVFDAVFAENNVHRVHTLDELVDVAYACAGGVFPHSRRLGVVTLSGGVGIQMADAAMAIGLEMPRMPDAAQQKVLAMIPFAGPANPVDTTAQVVNDWTMFTTILGIVAEEGAVDSVVSFLAHGNDAGPDGPAETGVSGGAAALPGSRLRAVRAHAARDGRRLHRDGLSDLRGPNARDRGGGGACPPAGGICGVSHAGAIGTRRRKAAAGGPDQRSGGKAAAGGGRRAVRAGADCTHARGRGRGSGRDRLSGRPEGAVGGHHAQVRSGRCGARIARRRRSRERLRCDDGARRRARAERPH